MYIVARAMNSKMLLGMRVELLPRRDILFHNLFFCAGPSFLATLPSFLNGTTNLAYQTVFHFLNGTTNFAISSQTSWITS